MSFRSFSSAPRHLAPAILTALLLAPSTAAFAVPVATAFADSPTCDTLSGGPLSDELGDPSAFPAGERISSFDVLISAPVCLPTKLAAGTADTEVTIINLNAISFSDVWYVAEPSTSFTNVDGTINGMIAFKIDALGINTPLIAESITANGIFEPGEAWRFIVQDYFNSAGLPASAFTEIGVPSLGPTAAASIVALPIPEPGTLGLLVLGLTGLAIHGRPRARRAC